jgi:hypothetical protein
VYAILSLLLHDTAARGSIFSQDYRNKLYALKTNYIQFKVERLFRKYSEFEQYPERIWVGLLTITVEDLMTVFQYMHTKYQIC